MDAAVLIVIIFVLLLWVSRIEVSMAKMALTLKRMEKKLDAMNKEKK
ncbi:MAG: hypothetical protein WDN27_01570 [Candidatus Saccharibacteria bacterium]